MLLTSSGSPIFTRSSTHLAEGIHSILIRPISPQVLRSLINQLSPASVPHYTIAHTLGTLAAVNTHGVVPHIKEILSKMLPLLSLVKADGLKQAFAYGKFLELQVHDFL